MKSHHSEHMNTGQRGRKCIAHGGGLGCPWRAFILIAGTVVFGILNVVYHWWSDWHLSIMIGEMHGVDLLDGLYKHHDHIIWNSLYSGPLMGWVPTIALMLLAGFQTTRTLLHFFRATLVSTTGIVTCVALWIVKIPVPVKYSNFLGLYHGALVW